MAGIGDMVSGAAGVATGIANIFGQKKAFKKRQELLDKREQENEDWYNQRYNEDATQRADAQAMLTRTQDMLRQQNADSKGTAAVMGGTEESQAATKAANAQAIADASSSIVRQADARKDTIEDKYRSQKDSLEQQRDQMIADQQQAMSDAISNIGESVGKVGSSFDPA